MNKYHSKRVYFNGMKFDSQKEFNRWNELKLLERAKRISGLQRQVPFVLIEKSEFGRAVKYIADFTYYDEGRFVVEDAKGYRTDVYKIKKRLMAEKYKIEVKES